MRRKLTKDQKFRQLKKYCEDVGLHVMGEDVKLGGGEVGKFLFQDPQNRSKGQFVVLDDAFDGDEDFKEQMDGLKQMIAEHFDH